MTKIIKFRERKVTHIRFSPCGEFLAISTEDGFLDVYNASSYVKKYSLRGNGNSINSFDWSDDSSFIAANTEDRDIIYFNLENGLKVSNLEMIKNINWSTHSRIYSWETQGIFTDEEENEPLTVDVFNSEMKGETIVVAGYEKGDMKIFK